jgi:phosphomethylpyrimidine synthase
MLQRSTFSSGGAWRTQMYLARRADVSTEIVRVVEREHVPPRVLRDEVPRGRMIIRANGHHLALDPMAIGLRARVTIDANVCTTDRYDAGMRDASDGCGGWSL